MRIPLIAAAIAVASAAAPALAAPPSCDKILDDGLRRSCQERMERCEPLKTAAERDECYRGPRSPRGTPLATAGAPVPLVPASPAPAAQAPVREAAVKPAPQPPAQQPNPAPPPAAPHPTMAQPVLAAPPAAPWTAPKPGSAAALPPTALAPTALTPKATAPAPTPASPAHAIPASPAHAIPAPQAHAIPVQPAAPAAVARPAAMAVPPRPAAPAATPEQVVRAFYDALSRADGMAANSTLIPEKRGSGAYEPAAISRYYGAMREPLRVLGLKAGEPGMVQVRYTYTHASGRRCDGAAEVAISLRDGAPLIERIKALNGC